MGGFAQAASGFGNCRRGSLALPGTKSRDRMNKPTASTLKRKAGADRPEPDHGLVTPVRALRLAVSRAAQEVLRVQFRGGDVTEARSTLGDMGESLPKSGLWVLIRGPGAAAGVVTLDPSLLAAVLQAQTTGRVTGAQVSERQPTQTDAIMARRFLTVLLETFALRLEGSPAARWAAGFQPRDRIADVARLPHLLPDVVYRGLVVDVDIAAGQRSGRLGLVMPQDPPGLAEGAADAGAEPDMRAEAWAGALAQQVLDSPAILEAVLHRLEIPLSELPRLQPGFVLMLPKQALHSVSLEGGDGVSAGVARLGQSQGRRAVKLVVATAPQDEMAADLRGPGTVPQQTRSSGRGEKRPASEPGPQDAETT